MISNIAIVYVILLNKIQNINTYLANDKKDLINIIKSLNYDNNEKMEHGDKDAEKDEFLNLSDETKEKKLQQMLWLLKKNFKALKLHDDLIKEPVHTGSRIYFIKNPDVLEKYKNYVKKKTLHSSADSELIKLKRRTESITDPSSDQSEINVDRTEGQDDKERSSETTQIKIDSVQDKQSLNAEEKTVNYLNGNKEESSNERSREDTAEHNIRAQEDTDNKDKKEQITDTNDKSEIDRKQKDKKDRYKTLERKEKRYDSLSQDSYVPFRPKNRVNYRKPKNEGKRDYFSYGRTSIPYIGKKGVYEDK